MKIIKTSFALLLLILCGCSITRVEVQLFEQPKYLPEVGLKHSRSVHVNFNIENKNKY